MGTNGGLISGQGLVTVCIDTTSIGRVAVERSKGQAVKLSDFPLRKTPRPNSYTVDVTWLPDGVRQEVEPKRRDRCHSAPPLPRYPGCLQRVPGVGVGELQGLGGFRLGSGAEAILSPGSGRSRTGHAPPPIRVKGRGDGQSCPTSMAQVGPVDCETGGCCNATRPGPSVRPRTTAA